MKTELKIIEEDDKYLKKEMDLLKCRKCGKKLSYLGSGQWGCDNCNYECDYNIVYFYNLGKKDALGGIGEK